VVLVKWLIGLIVAGLASFGAWRSLASPSPEPAPPIDVRGALIDPSSESAAEEPSANGPSVSGTEDSVPSAVAAAAATADRAEPAATEPVPNSAPDTPEPPPATAPSPSPGGHSGHGIASAVVPQGDGTYEVVTFDQLAAFEYVEPDPDFDDQSAARENPIPDAIQALQGSKIGIEGYIYPIGVENKKLRTFVLSRYLPNCCFGQLPNLNEWVDVEMNEQDAIDLELLPYGSALIVGTFDCGERLDDYGYVLSIYRMKAEYIQEQW
jgi:hypothetical protein